jgi:hypothetical protein
VIGLVQAEVALRAAGFDGVERVGAVIHARADGPSAPEFTLEQQGDGLRLTLRFAVRATDEERSLWMRAHPQGRLEIVQGETQLSLAVMAGADLAPALGLWRDLVQSAAKAAVDWQRRQKPLYGM